jgi:hypothetical protein
MGKLRNALTSQFVGVHPIEERKPDGAGSMVTFGGEAAFGPG